MNRTRNGVPSEAAIVGLAVEAGVDDLRRCVLRRGGLEASDLEKHPEERV